MEEFSKKYLTLLTTKYESLNLTRILEPKEFYEKQILDSVLPYQQSSFFKESIDKFKTVIDIGFGGGFPLLPLAFLLPDINFVGFEARRKKVDAVNDIASELGLLNVKAHHCLLEDILFDHDCVITFKAVGTMNDYLKLISAHCQCHVYFYKGPNYLKEIEDLTPIINKEWELYTEQKLDTPETFERHLIGFKRKNVPRGTAKRLVNLTSFL
jgi:16S rRNA (guanine527-N7)-methyltransferase